MLVDVWLYGKCASKQKEKNCHQTGIDNLIYLYIITLLSNRLSCIMCVTCITHDYHFSLNVKKTVNYFFSQTTCFCLCLNDFILSCTVWKEILKFYTKLYWKTFFTGDDDHDKQNRRKNLLGKKTDGKKGQKDKGYVMFDEDDSDESLVTSEDVK